MFFKPFPTGEVPQGTHYRGSTCIALVGPNEIDIRWAIQAMQIQFPINHKRALLCYPHANPDVSRNITIEQWRRAGKELATDWIALVLGGSKLRWDAVTSAVLNTDGAKCIHIDGTYILHKDVIAKVEAPWFVDGEWQGPKPVDRSDLTLEAIVPSTSIEPPDAEAVKTMVMMCIPSLGKTSLVWLSHAIKLAAPMASTGSLTIALGHEVGEARQKLTELVLGLEPCPKYMFFLGDDNIAPVNGLRCLMDTMRTRNAPAVAGLYHIKEKPPTVPILWRNDIPGPLTAGRDFAWGDIVECDGTGLDFVLFETSALRQMPGCKFKTLMEWIPGHGMRMQTEDAYFWERWVKLHGRVLVDTRVRVGHFDNRTGAIY